MTRREIRKIIYQNLGQTEGNSRFPPDQVNSIINSVLELICSSRPWDFLSKEETITVPYTTTSATSTGTTLYATSVSGLGNNRVLCVTDGTNFEYPEIESISGTTITLKGAGLAESYAAASHITLDKVFLPPDCLRPIAFKLWGDSNRWLDVNSAVLGDYSYPKRTSRGTPTGIFRMGLENYRESETDYTMDASSSPTTVIDSAAPSYAANDYFNGWLLVNVTRGLHSRVKDYVASTTTWTLKSKIPGQVSGDTFYLTPHLHSFVFDKIHTEALTIQLRYRSLPDMLDDDEDIPLIPRQYHYLLVWKPLVYLASADRNNPMAKVNIGVFENNYMDIYTNMMDNESVLSDGEQAQQLSW